MLQYLASKSGATHNAGGTFLVIAASAWRRRRLLTTNAAPPGWLGCLAFCFDIVEMLTVEVGLSAWFARKALAARASFLDGANVISCN